MYTYVLLVLCVLFWSGNFIIGRYIHEDITPVALAFFRWLGVVLIMLPIFLKKFHHLFRVLKSNFFIINFLALLGITGFNTILYTGLNHTTATNALLINSSIPVLILVFSFFILKVPIIFKQFIGILLSTFGVIFLIIKGDLVTLSILELNIGDIWIIASSLTWAMYSVVVRFRPKELNDIEFFTLIVYIGFLWLIPIYITFDGNIQADMLLVKEYYFVFIYISLFTSVLSYYFWHQGINTIGANKTGQFTHLMPLFGAILAYIFLDEMLQPFHVIGAFFIAIGIYLSLFSKK